VVKKRTVKRKVKDNSQTLDHVSDKAFAEGLGARPLKITTEPCPFCDGKKCRNCLNTGFVRVIK
jgi:hypothetical protein